jgi:hypothetical protein
MSGLDVPDWSDCAFVPISKFGHANHVPITSQVGRAVDIAGVDSMIQGGEKEAATGTVFHMLHGPIGKMWSVDLPILARLVAFKNEGAFAGNG